MKIKINSIFPDYELIDCGDGLKLERFGEIVLIRPEITATGKPELAKSEWQKLANAEFVENSKNSGSWKIYREIPDKWGMKFNSGKINLLAELALTNSKHIGIFPEQVLNWKFIESVNDEYPKMQFLNLFGYTGLTSVAAAAFSQRVTHIDSIKKVVEWTKRNAANSGFENVRCITEDAQKFVEREIKRGNKYDGIILDPPVIGVGANNEKWILDEMIDDLLTNISQILLQKSFVIMNLYAHNLSEDLIKSLITKHFPHHKIQFCAKVFGESRYGNRIDHGFFVRLLR
jgi:23S rRNA (cytosine1962-C5)-methyltransferase